MKPETSLQWDMFTGELVDTRTPKQKRRDEERGLPQQMEMFSPREVLQFGVDSHPVLPLIDQAGRPVKMQLEVQDPRTDGEKAEDTQREAERRTYGMFEDADHRPDHASAAMPETMPSEMGHPATDHAAMPIPTPTKQDRMKQKAIPRESGGRPGVIGIGERVVPIYSQYSDIKRQFPQAIVFFRLGDFFETFGEDAEVIARELDIVLTSRNISKSRRIPMAGVPHHTAESYIARLIEKGYHVAVCEQVGNEPINGLMPREVVRVLAPGQPSDQPPLPEAESLPQVEPPPEKPALRKRLTWDEFRRRALGSAQENLEEGEWGAHEI